ncbi:uncharacterized protein [Ptychodera flava]|uniref:uncharacterized protein isoform X2 n=1 Tax=Ptychodera flava TaxID=63121 RepID=UPI00396A9824
MFRSPSKGYIIQHKPDCIILLEQNVISHGFNGRFRLLFCFTAVMASFVVLLSLLYAEADVPLLPSGKFGFRDRNESIQFTLNRTSDVGDTTSIVLNNTKRNTSSSETREEIIPANRFLLPIIVESNTDPGKTWDFFKRALLTSIHDNRSLVMSPFFVLNTNTSSHQAIHMNFTFDFDRLEEAVPVATLDEFKENCRNKLQLRRCDSSKGYDVTRNIFTEFTGIDLPDSLEVLDMAPMGGEEFKNFSNSPCLGVYNPCGEGLQGDAEVPVSVIRDLQRAPFIVEVADAVMLELGLTAEAFAAVEWPNNIFDNKALVTESENNSNNGSTVTEKQVKLATDKLKSILESKNIKCMYVTTSPWIEKVVDILSNEIPSLRIMTSNDVRPILKSEFVNDFPDDAYTLSFLEQEICYRSSVFLSSSPSGWFKFVKEQRNATGRTTVDILSLIESQELEKT